MRYLVYAAALFFVSSAAAHEWTPTYPKLKSSYVDGVMVTSMHLFNKRFDVRYYELEVFDSKWKPIPFASTNKIIQLGYLQHKDIDVYIRQQDKEKVEYICTTSKLLRKDVESSGVTSKICSKFK